MSNLSGRITLGQCGALTTEVRGRALLPVPVSGANDLTEMLDGIVSHCFASSCEGHREPLHPSLCPIRVLAWLV